MWELCYSKLCDTDQYHIQQWEYNVHTSYIISGPGSLVGVVKSPCSVFREGSVYLTLVGEGEGEEGVGVGEVSPHQQKDQCCPCSQDQWAYLQRIHTLMRDMNLSYHII